MFCKFTFVLTLLSAICEPSLFAATNKSLHSIPAWKKKALAKKIRYQEQKLNKFQAETKRVRRSAIMTIIMLSVAQVAEIYNRSSNSTNTSKKITKKPVQKLVLELEIHDCSTIQNSSFSILAPFSKNNSLQIGIVVEDNTKINAALINHNNKKCLKKTYELDYGEVFLKKEDTREEYWLGYTPKFKKSSQKKIGGTQAHDTTISGIGGIYSSDELYLENFYSESMTSLQLEWRFLIYVGNDPSALFCNIRTSGLNRLDIKEIPEKDWMLDVLSHELVHQQQCERKSIDVAIKKISKIIPENLLKFIIANNEEINADIIGSLNLAILINNPEAILYRKERYHRYAADVIRFYEEQLNLEKPFFSEKGSCNSSTHFCLGHHPNQKFRSDRAVDLKDIAEDFMKYFEKNYRMLF